MTTRIDVDRPELDASYIVVGDPGKLIDRINRHDGRDMILTLRDGGTITVPSRAIVGVEPAELRV
jgi:hypothetical protein